MSGKAESRLLYSSISFSERTGSLGSKGALLFTWLLTHCDSQGRMQGKPSVFKNLVAPFVGDITIEDTNESLELMEKAKLILRYKDSKDRNLIQVIEWWEYQTGLKYKSASHYEPPSNWEDKITQRDENGKFIKESGY
ncbi:hypothetical protein ACFLWF_00025 [Chloroflexota bacterium]